MKKMLLPLIGSAMLFSCQKDNLASKGDLDNAKPKTYAATATSPNLSNYNLKQLGDIPLNIKLVYPMQNSKVFLSGTVSTNEVVLWTHDDGSLRHRWIIRNGTSIFSTGGTKGYNNCPLVRVENGKNNFYAYLTVLKPLSPGGISLPPPINFRNIPDTPYYYIVIPVYEDTSFPRPLPSPPPSRWEYMYAEATNKEWVKFAPQSQTGGRDRWEIIPVESFDLLDVKYEQTGFTGFSQANMALEAVLNRRFDNSASPVEATFTNNISEQVIEKSTFSKVHGVTLTNKISASIGVKIPFIADGKINTDLTTTTSWTYSEGKEETRTRTVSDTYSFKIPPYSAGILKIYVAKYYMDVTYVAKLRGKQTGRVIEVRGIWSGVQASELAYDLSLEGTNQKLAVPNKISLTELTSGF